MDQHLTARIPEANTFVTLGVAKITTNLHQSVSALVFSFVYSKIFPSTCSLCDLPSVTRLDLCDSCDKALPRIGFSCFTCGLPLIDTDTAHLPGSDKKQLLCGKCLTEPSPIDEAIIPFLYEAPIDYMVKRLKFSADMKYSRLMGELLALKISEGCSTWPDCLLPVPLHHSRLLERGYNQAFQIADIVSKRLCIPVEQDCASRITSQASQVQLNARDRTKNLRSAFSVTTRVTDKKIAIIDDVYTTGATTRSLAMTLKKAGASSVSIWAFARTP